MSKLLPVETDGEITGYYYDCPGCKDIHYLTVRPHRAGNGASWDFNGDFDKPTFRPSVLQRLEPSQGSGMPPMICHSFVTDGRIEFLSDCTHELAGQTVDLPERV